MHSITVLIYVDFPAPFGPVINRLLYTVLDVFSLHPNITSLYIGISQHKFQISVPLIIGTLLF